MAETKGKGKFKGFLLDTLFDIIGSALYAIAILYFASPANYAPGGLTGISLIIHHYFSFIPIGTCTFLLNIPILLICGKTLGKKMLLKSVKTMIISTIIMDVVAPFILQGSSYATAVTGEWTNAERMISALFSGVISGAGLSALYYRGSTSGGSDFIIFTVQKKLPQFSIGMLTLVIDGAIILAGGVVFKDVTAVLLGIIMTFASAIVMEKIMYGFGSGKMTMIITNHGDEIAKGIAEEIDRGSTIITGRGTFTGDTREVLLCAASKREAVKIRSVVRKTDPKAILFLSSVDELYGYGFTDIQK